MTLPIEAVAAQLTATLENSPRVILQAPPGAGKSTCVPLMLLNKSWLAGQKIILLEPRRLAARSVARRLALSLGEKVGETVGYRIRLDTCVGENTRIEVVTEGILSRQIQSDPELLGVGCVIFDEFHERSLQADLGLALCLDSQEVLREDLRILVMSATLDTQALVRLLDQAPVVISEGRQYPVETFYLPRKEVLLPASRIAFEVLRAWRDHAGSILVFLPGRGEIRQVAELLDSSRGEDGLDDLTAVTPLYGGLDLQAQDAAIRMPEVPQRKIVLSTSIAETSLTIDGITVVVDAGMDRRAAFSPASGMTRLVTEPVSLASADQRRGRAGRVEPGVCYRLWSEAEQNQRKSHAAAEIMGADLAPLLLELAQWGIADLAQLKWLDLPPIAHVSQARSLLQMLGALDDKGRITPHGKAMAKLGTHPRLAHMLIRAQQWGVAKRACDFAALLGERSPIRGREKQEDFAARLACLSGRGAGADRGIVARVKQQSSTFLRQLKGPAYGEKYAASAGQLLALAYPDRIAQRRAGSDVAYRLSGGGAATFREPSVLSYSDYLVITELDGRQREARIFSAVAVDLQALEEIFAEQIVVRQRVTWDDRSGSVVAEQQRCLGELVLERSARDDIDPEQLTQAMLEAIAQKDLSVLPWTKDLRQWQARVLLLRKTEGEASTLPDLSDNTLLRSMDEWLAPWMDKVSRLSHLKKLDLKSILFAMLDWNQQQHVEAQMPTHFTVPSGSRIRLKYEGQETPVLAVRIQEMFSCTQTPAIANGKLPLLIHLLTPAQRPIQITQDLLSFWANGYTEVKKELKGRYPKHHWPEDPLNTAPHRTVRPRK